MRSGRKVGVITRDVAGDPRRLGPRVFACQISILPANCQASTFWPIKRLRTE
jgi:hypothetical protein